MAVSTSATICIPRHAVAKPELWSGSAPVVFSAWSLWGSDEPGSWEATWFHRGDPEFPVFHAGRVSFGLNICTELWALETYAAYAAFGIDLLLAPRATALATTDRWLAVGVVAAIRSGAFCLSSNRIDESGAGGGGGWIIDPAGEVLALTSAGNPFATLDLDLTGTANARDLYPRYVFTG